MNSELCQSVISVNFFTSLIFNVEPLNFELAGIPFCAIYFVVLFVVVWHILDNERSHSLSLEEQMNLSKISVEA